MQLSQKTKGHTCHAFCHYDGEECGAMYCHELCGCSVMGCDVVHAKPRQATCSGKYETPEKHGHHDCSLKRWMVMCCHHHIKCSSELCSSSTCHASSKACIKHLMVAVEQRPPVEATAPLLIPDVSSFPSSMLVALTRRHPFAPDKNMIFLLRKLSRCPAVESPLAAVLSL